MSNLLIVILLVTTGCAVVPEYEDISSSQEYGSIIDRGYRTKSELLIHGVNRDTPVGKAVQEYVVTPQPGFMGREMLKREELAAGTTIKLSKVLRCRNCYLDIVARKAYVIEILSSDKYQDHEIHLVKNFGGTNLLLVEDEQYSLNPEYFQIINE